MSALSLATWAAVVVLVFGSTGIFVWFLFDAGKVLHGSVGESEDGPEDA